MGCCIELPMLENIRSVFKIWSHDLTMFLASRRELHFENLHEQFLSRTHAHADYDSCKKSSDVEEVETTKDTIVEHPKPAGKCVEYPKLIDCDDESQSTWIFPLFETFMIFYFLEKYIEQPCEETKKPLMQLLEDGNISYGERFTPEKIDNFSNSIRTFLNDKYSQDMHNKNENFSRCTVNLGCQPRSISDEVSSRELESAKQKPNKPLSDFRNNETNFLDNENQRKKEKQQYNNKQPNCQKQFRDILIQPSQEPVRKQNSGKSRTSGKKNCKQCVNISQPNTPAAQTSVKSLSSNDFQNASTSNEDLQIHLRALIEKNQMLREKCRVLKKRVESLEIGNQEILADLGQWIVEKAAKENEERKSKVLQSTICPKVQPGDVFVDKNTADVKDFRLGYPKESDSKKIAHLEVGASVVTAPPDGEQSVQGAEALVPASNNRQQRKEVGSSSFSLKERASGGEGNNKPENIKASNVLASASEGGIALSFSVQQDYSNETEYISLDHRPIHSVATLLYTNYKLLLVSQSQLLLSTDVMKLMDWAALNFSIENTQNPTDVLLQLDKKGVINASDLSPLRNFFESIVRFDLVYIIDEFLLGDYTLLHKISVMKKRDATKALQNPQHASRYTRALSSLRQTSLQGSTSARSAASSGSLRMITDPATLRKPENSNGAQSSLPQPRHEPLFPNTSTLSNANNSKPPWIIPNENQSSVQQQNLKSTASGFTEQSVVVVNSPIANERRTTAANPSTRKNASMTNSARNTQKFGNDSSKLSKSQPPESSVVSHTHHHDASGNPDLELESNWLCSHYKRHCYVKFECCDKFWPCHRCHNNQSTCGQKKLKSRDTQMVKCVYCKKVQPFGQFCCNCAAKFSSYFCGMCKHLTGNDDHPYHCDKCGICRIHGDRSFHCDVCGVCLDVQLRGNHKCRAGSAHDECCICLEDAFTGCQILPCSHKVHKECATQMIRSGITRCPICRESFAHKLERRPLQSRKRSGK